LRVVVFPPITCAKVGKHRFGRPGYADSPVDRELVYLPVIAAIAFENYLVSAWFLFAQINKITFFVFFNNGSGNAVGRWPVVYRQVIFTFF